MSIYNLGGGGTFIGGVNLPEIKKGPGWISVFGALANAVEAFISTPQGGKVFESVIKNANPFFASQGSNNNKKTDTSVH